MRSSLDVYSEVPIKAINFVFKQDQNICLVELHNVYLADPHPVPHPLRYCGV